MRRPSPPQNDPTNGDRSCSFRSALCAFTLLIFSLFQPCLIRAQQGRATESQIKAVYLYNFGKFVRWHSSSTGAESFDICIIGQNSFGSVLEATVAGEHIDGNNIVVRNITSTQEAGHCKILFVSSSESQRLKALLTAVRQPNLLTVSDIPDFAERGGMIGLVNEEGRIRFEVNLAAVNDSRLTVSSELLKVAVRVLGAGQPRGSDK